MKQLGKQYNLGPWLGGFKDLASRTMVYVSAISFTQITATFYYTTLFPNLKETVPWLTFWMFFGTLVLMVLVIMLIEYKFILPSSYTFLNEQEYKHENLIRKDIRLLQEEMKTEIQKLREEINASRNNSSS
ncbi:hypothetical protein LCGC14_0902260 [marine sediment metagenome]|uniref:Uncharacterized protein n=1 Tax=marine sediment metagenome TaxID=412755 RepID=A0A0F9RF48_9ZZZZ